MLKILDVGSGVGNVGMINVFFGDVEKEYVRMDINPDVNPDIIHDITKPYPEEVRGQFDIVFACHVLEHMGRDEVFPAIRNMASALKNLGELWVLVPDLEWCAKEIIAGHNSMAVQGLIYGAQRQDNNWDIHKSGFTLKDLRRLMELVGLLVKRAYQSEFLVLMGDKKFPAIQDICIGARYDGLHEERPVEEAKEESAPIGIDLDTDVAPDADKLESA
jgi:SAM-dependent methyltransferase